MAQHGKFSQGLHLGPMVQNAADTKSRTSAGYGSQKAGANSREPVDVQGLSDAALGRKGIVISPPLSAEEEGRLELEAKRAVLAEERAAKLADLRAQKEKLLAMKAAQQAKGAAQQAKGAAQEAKLVEAKREQEERVHLEEGMRRGLKGFALKEYAQEMLADATQCATLAVQTQRDINLDEGMRRGLKGFALKEYAETLCNLEEVSKEEVRALVIDSLPQDGSKEEATEHGVEGSTHQEIEEQPDITDIRLRREENARIMGALPQKNETSKGHRTRKNQMRVKNPGMRNN